MKRLLLNLLVGLLTFFLGFSVQNLTVTKPNSVTGFFVEKREVLAILPAPLEIKRKTEPNQIEQKSSEDNEEFGFHGWYSVDNFKGMNEVWTINLSKDSQDSDAQKLVWSAIVLTDNENNIFDSVWIDTSNNKLSFKTKRNRKIEYQFDGTFFKGKKSGSSGEKVLRGTLRKFVKGKEVAKIKADFAYYEPHCWH